MEVMMKELGEIITGNTPSKKTEAFWSSEDICFIKPDIIADDGINEIVDSNEYISEDARKKARVVGKNSIFITCIGSIGKIGIASDGEYAFNQQINAIMPNDRVQPKYLAYNLLFNKPRLVAIANAPVVPIINKSQFGEFTVNIETDIDRQCEIVDVLDKLTQINQQSNKEISALDELIKARFVEMFGDPRTNSKGFETKNGSELFKISNGKAVPNNKRFEEGIPAYGGNGISWYTDDALCDKDTIVIGRVGFQSGNVHLVKGPVWITDNAMYISDFYDDNLSLVFLCEMMEQIDFTKHQDAGDLKKVTQKPFMEMKYIIPSKELQSEYMDFVIQVYKSKVAVQKALDETKLLFDSLMQQYFG